MELKNFFVQDQQGNVVPNAVINVYQQGTLVLVSGLQDKDENPLANPFNASAAGLVSFRAPDGIYDIKVSASGREFTITAEFVDITEYASSRNIAELEDVVITGLQNNFVLRYNSLTQKWVAVDLAPETVVQLIPDSSYTIVGTDRSKHLRFTNSSLVSVTVPLDSVGQFSDSFQATVIQAGLGEVSIIPQVGVTLNFVSDSLAATRLQYSSIALIRVGSNQWDVVGDLKKV